MAEKFSFARYIAVSLACGFLFALMDGLIHANRLARKLYEVYRPIARTSVNAPAGMAIDLVYGFVMTAVFVLLYKSLPGSTGLVRGISFALLVWFFRVAMGVAGAWMTLAVPGKLHAYELLAGLVEMIVLGILLGLAFRSERAVAG